MKPCSVNLNKIVFKEIRIKCTDPSSSKNVKISWDLKQRESNSFTLSIKRKVIDDDPDVNALMDSLHGEKPIPKRARFNETKTDFESTYSIFLTA